MCMNTYIVLQKKRNSKRNLVKRIEVLLEVFRGHNTILNNKKVLFEKLRNRSLAKGEIIDLHLRPLHLKICIKVIDFIPEMPRVTIDQNTFLCYSL